MHIVIVGNGSFAPLKIIGHGTLHSPSRPLALHNVLVCLDLHKFVTDNWCSIEFHHFGFSVKDIQTWNKLLRCDNSRPLYSVTPTPSSSSSHALVATVLWGRGPLAFFSLIFICQLNFDFCFLFFSSRNNFFQSPPFFLSVTPQATCKITAPEHMQGNHTKP